MEKAVAKATAFLFYGYLRMQLMAHVRSATEILKQYDGKVPFAAWLKGYFKEHKKFGSKDRRLVADLCFCYFRLGHALPQFSVEDRILAGQALCHPGSGFVAQAKPEWLPMENVPLGQKLNFLRNEASQQIFPFAEKISPEIEKQAFVLSFLQQPDVFLRLRPGKEKVVVETLQKEGMHFQQEGTCLRLPHGTKADAVLRIDEDVVVQDASSQQVLAPLQAVQKQAKFSAWDCCAASGGKTILLHDAYPKAALTVSDIRES
ncbi:MAG: Fmu (Sun) domain-containing protein, partial [Chitinophagaceae bacterium]